MELYLVINQDLKDLLDIISPLSVMITAWIAFTVYIFNYEMKSYFGSLEITINQNDKLISIITGIIFIIFTIFGAFIATKITKKIFHGYYTYYDGIGSYNIYDTSSRNKFFFVAIIILIILIIVLLVIFYSNLKEKFKQVKIQSIYIMNIIIGIITGSAVVFIILNRIEDDYESLVVVLIILIYIFIYYLTLRISGIMYCQVELNLKIMYELNYNNKGKYEEINCYLIGVFNGFFQIKDSYNNMRFINKDEIKEMRKIGTVCVEGNEKLKWLKKFIWGEQYKIYFKIEEIIKKNDKIKNMLNDIEKYYKEDKSIEECISRKRYLEIKSNSNDNIIYGIIGGFITLATTVLFVPQSAYELTIKNLKHNVTLYSMVLAISLTIINFLFFRPTYKKNIRSFIINEEKEILNKKIEELLKVNTFPTCKEVEKNENLLMNENELSNNKQNIN